MQAMKSFFNQQTGPHYLWSKLLLFIDNYLFVLHLQVIVSFDGIAPFYGVNGEKYRPGFLSQMVAT